MTADLAAPRRRSAENASGKGRPPSGSLRRAPFINPHSGSAGPRGFALGRFPYAGPRPDPLPVCDLLHGDKGYDANPIRQQIEERGALANISPKTNRKWKCCFSPFLYRNRNAIERMFCRLKDFRRVATRYDRNAANFLAAVCIVATVSYWL